MIRIWHVKFLFLSVRFFELTFLCVLWLISYITRTKHNISCIFINFCWGGGTFFPFLYNCIWKKKTQKTKHKQELQLHLGVLQQHAALIGGPNATSCPICHKLFLGGEALMEHMKHTHKDPNASGVASKLKLLLVFFVCLCYISF